MQTTLDKFGRIVLPKPVRELFDLEPGAVLQIETSDGSIILKPTGDEPHLVTKKGVLVYRGKALGELDQAVQAHRQRRMKATFPAEQE